MGKIKIFDISLTMMAFAMLIFLLPQDQQTTNGKGNHSISGHVDNGSKAALQTPIPARTDILRTT